MYYPHTLESVFTDNHYVLITQQRIHARATYVFKPGARGRRPHVPGFLKLLWFACQYACVSAPEGVNNQWCDIGCVQLVKQVSQLFPALITLYDTYRR